MGGGEEGERQRGKILKLACECVEKEGGKRMTIKARLIDTRTGAIIFLVLKSKLSKILVRLTKWGWEIGRFATVCASK